jgi:ABC-type sugar transport system permease subunit
VKATDPSTANFERALSQLCAANAVTPDRQRAELAALSAPAVLFTLAMIAFPVAYTVWLSFHAFSSTGRQSFVGLGNLCQADRRQ